VRIHEALEGKDVKDLRLNVGSGGGAAPAAGGAAPAAGGAADAAPAAEEKKEEGMFTTRFLCNKEQRLTHNREGGVGRGHGLRSLRLSVSFPFLSSTFAFLGVAKRIHQRAYSHCWGGTVTTIR
jgi:hypothetical protein